MNIFNFFIQRSFHVNLLSLFIVVAGVLAIFSMKRDLHPPFERNIVRVSVALPGATPEEMESAVIMPIQDITRAMRGVERVTSVSRNGSGEIRYHFPASFKAINETRDMIRERISSIEYKLPQDIRNISVDRLRQNEVFVSWLGLAGFDRNNQDHFLHLERLEEEIRQIEGITNISRGLPERQLVINFDHQKLQEFEVNIDEIKRLIMNSGRVSPIGLKDLGNNNHITVSLSRSIESIKDLKGLPIRSNRSGEVIYLSDLANIYYQFHDSPKEIHFINGRQGIFLSVHKDLESDSLDIMPQVMSVVENFNASTDHFEVIDYVNGAQFIEQQINVLVRNGLLGIVLVLFVLMIFLNFMTALMTNLGLLVAYAGTFVILYLFGINFDLFSIVGMILVIGLLVDDAIILSEKYTDHLGNGLSAKDAALKAIHDLVLPVTGTILTTIVAFLPMIFIKSDLTNVFFAIPLIVIASLILSWGETFFILPNHLSHFVKRPLRLKKQRAFYYFQNIYKGVLSFLIKWRYVSIIFASVLTGLGFWLLINKVDQNFNLQINEESIAINVELVSSSSFEDSREQLREMEEFINNLPAGLVENIRYSIGQRWAHWQRLEGYEHALFVVFLPRNLSKTTPVKEQLQELIDKKIEEIFDEEKFKLLGSSIQQGANQEEATYSSVTLQVQGRVREDFSLMSEILSEKITALDEIKTFHADPNLMQKKWSFSPNSDRLRQYNLTYHSLSSQIRGLFTLDFIDELRVDGDFVNIYAQINGRAQLSFEELNQLTVITPRGLSVPLSELGDWSEEVSLRQIHHLNGIRNNQFVFEIEEGINMTSALSAIGSVLPDLQEIYPSYIFNVINTNESEQDSQAWALKVALVCFLGIFIILALVLGSLTTPFLVILPIPFALSGIFYTHFFHDLTFGLMSAIGVIGCMGVSVNASLVLMSEINKRSGSLNLPKLGEIIDGTLSRFRPIVLTTITTLAGVFPMAYSLGGESGFTWPMAFSLGWGVLASTLFTTLFLPPILMIRTDFFSLVYRVKDFIFREKKGAQEALDSRPITPLPQLEKTDSGDEKFH